MSQEQLCPPFPGWENRSSSVQRQAAGRIRRGEGGDPHSQSGPGIRRRFRSGAWADYLRPYSAALNRARRAYRRRRPALDDGILVDRCGRNERSPCGSAASAAACGTFALAYREALSTPDTLKLAESSPPAELMLDHRTPASRLLFSKDPIRVTLPQSDLVGHGSAGRTLHRELLVASTLVSATVQTFSAQIGTGSGGQGFAGPAVKALPIWRVAQSFL